ncbi:Hypothetical protein CINCED_3A014340 [Cinara cedri]|uniref:Uncharacterized protein n=1 Tax=Cinara cedri TaxID=506608 RepID=A0A5E4MMJ5_9HEMI|nr:Hypothetical protein CINCED_3A014340 [Cinara cedri]
MTSKSSLGILITSMFIMTFKEVNTNSSVGPVDDPVHEKCMNHLEEFGLKYRRYGFDNYVVIFQKFIEEHEIINFVNDFKNPDKNACSVEIWGVTGNKYCLYLKSIIFSETTALHNDLGGPEYQKIIEETENFLEVKNYSDEEFKEIESNQEYEIETDDVLEESQSSFGDLGEIDDDVELVNFLSNNDIINDTNDGTNLGLIANSEVWCQANEKNENTETIQPEIIFHREYSILSHSSSRKISSIQSFNSSLSNSSSSEENTSTNIHRSNPSLPNSEEDTIHRGTSNFQNLLSPRKEDKDDDTLNEAGFKYNRGIENAAVALLYHMYEQAEKEHVVFLSMYIKYLYDALENSEKNYERLLMGSKAWSDLDGASNYYMVIVNTWKLDCDRIEENGLVKQYCVYLENNYSLNEENNKLGLFGPTEWCKFKIKENENVFK